MGSEMCIRDSDKVGHSTASVPVTFIDVEPCLLYTSDAADEEDSVDLGGRRIIKKKKKKKFFFFFFLFFFFFFFFKQKTAYEM